LEGWTNFLLHISDWMYVCESLESECEKRMRKARANAQPARP